VWWLLAGCSLIAQLRPDPEHTQHQLEREMIAQRMRNAQLKEQLSHCTERSQDALDALYTELLQVFRSSEVSVTRRVDAVAITIPGDLLFASGTTRIRAEAEQPLSLLAVALSIHGELQVTVVGHTDNRELHGRLEQAHTDNWGLSTARAASVMRKLVSTHALAPARFTVAGRGATKPIADNATSAGQSLNRRVEVLLAGG
jgi:chemotaxis protein MotB